MALLIELDRNDSTPLYRQIAESVKERIGDGSLPTGSRLPTIRALATRLGTTRLTVQHAYDELHADGFIESTVGRGTFVTGAARPQDLLRTVGLNLTPDGVLQDEFVVKGIAGMRLMSSADPDAAAFPLESFWGSLETLRHDASSLAYTAAQGEPSLRVAFAESLRERGIEVEPDELIITNGVTHGLALLAQTLCRPGDAVLVEEPTYLGFLNLLKAQGLQPLGVPLDNEGLDLAVMERLIIQRRPRFLYTVPTYQNPTGLCMSVARREGLLELAAAYGLLIIEDDIYARLAYDAPPPPALKSQDAQDLVIYLDSVSKVLMPGLRLGVMLAPQPLRARLLSLRRAQDLCGSPLLQRALAHFMREGHLRAHLHQGLPKYRERRDAVLASLKQRMPEGVRWTEPGGGFCTWLTLPDTEQYDDLYRAALLRGLTFTPGEIFLADGSPRKHLRLCFGSQTVDRIRSSVALLAALIEERTPQSRRVPGRLLDWPPIV